jgi:hypothetical protein
MKKALVDTVSKLVVQVEDTVFDVASSHVWVDCPDNITGGWYTYENNQFNKISTSSGAPATSEEIRKMRNARLADTDWTQLADSQVDKQVWATYRQALRDIPTQSGFPTDFTWPKKPQ